MKKILTMLVALGLIINLSAQSFQFNGKVFNMKENHPQVNHSVYSMNLSSEKIFKTTTDSMGYFTLLVDTPDDSTVYSVYTLDICSGDTLIQYHYPYMSSNVFGFYICDDSVTSECKAYFTYSIVSGDSSFNNTGTYDTIPGDTSSFWVQFTNLSEGENLSYNWSFGDGSYSSETNPMHKYSIYGSYNVELLANNETCESIFYQNIGVSNDSSDCYAAFWYTYGFNQDSSINNDIDSTEFDLRTFRFYDASSAGANKWIWKFGDGEYSFEQNPLHTFPNDGEFMVSLTVSSDECSSTTQMSVYAGKWDNPWEDSCMAYFGYYYEGIDSLNYSDSSNMHFLTLNFIDWSNGNPTSWYWNFGDGGTSTDKNPSHTYAVAGKYIVSLSISSDSCSNTIELPVIAGNWENPNDTIWYPDNCMAFFYPEFLGDNAMKFHNESYGNVKLSVWDFGDGNSSEEFSPEHSYSVEGEYLVKLFIETKDSCTSIFETIVYVGEWADSTQLKAMFVPEIDDLVVQFHNKSEGDIWHYYWDFGDGKNSTTTSPIHQYAEKDKYLVTLGIGNATEVKTYTIELDLNTGTFIGIAGDKALGLKTESKTESSLQVYPLPLQDKVTIVFNSEYTGAGTVSISNLNGMEIVKEKLSLVNGLNSTEQSIGNLEKGIYILRIELPNRDVIHYKLIK